MPVNCTRLACFSHRYPLYNLVLLPALRLTSDLLDIEQCNTSFNLIKQAYLKKKSAATDLSNQHPLDVVQSTVMEELDGTDRGIF